MNLNISGLTKQEKKFILSQFTLGELFGEVHRRTQYPGEEEEEEEEEEEAVLGSEEERSYAFGRLVSCYPCEIVELVLEGKMEVPLWLQKEILKVRQGGLVE